MKAVVSEKYRSLSNELLKASRNELPVEKVFCNKRNRVELVTVGGRKLVVKHYKRPGFFNGMIYTLFRKSKARRAYEYANLLNERGFHSPTPVAYYEKKNFGVFRDGCFIAEYVDFPSVRDIFFGENQLATDSPERSRIAGELSDLTLQLHRKGIQPLDYNMSNILIDNQGEKPIFWLIDLNRMELGKQPGLKHAMLSFFQLGTYYPDYEKLLRHYADSMGWDLETCIYHVIRHRRSFNRLRNFKHLFKRK